MKYKIFTSDIIKAITAKKYRGADNSDIEFQDVIKNGEYLINCFNYDSYNNRPCNIFGIKKINGKFKIYAIKFSSWQSNHAADGVYYSANKNRGGKFYKENNRKQLMQYEKNKQFFSHSNNPYIIY